MEKMHIIIRNMTHLLNLTQMGFITINEMAETKKLTGWYAKNRCRS